MIAVGCSSTSYSRTDRSARAGYSSTALKPGVERDWSAAARRLPSRHPRRLRARPARPPRWSAPVPVGGHADPRCTVVTADVRLSADLLDCPGSGLVIAASGITIDLAGHTVAGTGSGAGIDNSGDCAPGPCRAAATIIGFLFGVRRATRPSALMSPSLTASPSPETWRRATGSAGSSTGSPPPTGRLDANVMAHNTGPGLTLDRSAGATVKRSLAAGNASDGIFLVGVDTPS